MQVRGRWLLGLCIVVVIAAVGPATRLWKAERILGRLSSGPAETANAQPEHAVLAEDAVVPTGDVPLRARVYRLAKAGTGPGVVVAHGVHYRGIDEPRLVAFSRALAESGLVVLTPELRDLADYRITARTAEHIAASVRHLASRSDLIDGRVVGLLGFSFAGGLSLVAASAPDVGARLAWVASVGGHHDLARVLRFFAEDRVATPRGLSVQQAHEYGVLVLVYDNLEAFVPEEDRALMKDALRAWLHEDRASARAIAARRTSAQADRLFSLVEANRLGELRPEFETLIAGRTRELDAVSPHGKLAAIGPPVYLLHGTSDSVIPSSETEWADLELGRHEHRALVSPLLEHVEVSHQATLVAKLELLEFMAHLVETGTR